MKRTNVKSLVNKLLVKMFENWFNIKEECKRFQQRLSQLQVCSLTPVYATRWEFNYEANLCPANVPCYSNYPKRVSWRCKTSIKRAHSGSMVRHNRFICSLCYGFPCELSLRKHPHTEALFVGKRRSWPALVVSTFVRAERCLQQRTTSTTIHSCKHSFYILFHVKITAA